MSKKPASRTLPALLEEQVTAHGNREALVGSGTRLSYAEMKVEVGKIARRLIALGVRPGDKVGILMGNRPEWVLSALAITSIGGVMVAMNSWSTHRELEYLIRNSDSRFVIASPTFLKHDYAAILDGFGDLRAKFPLLDGIMAVGDVVPAGWLPLRVEEPEPDPVLNAELTRRSTDVMPDDIAFILYTSGSTSVPKGVQLTHRSLIDNPFEIGERQHVQAGEKLWLAVSLFWGLGSVNAMMNLITHGGCIVLQEHFDAAEALKIIATEQCQLFYGTPNMAQAMHEHPDRAHYDLSCLRGGATLGTPDQIRRVIELGATEICNIYGLTETYGNSHVTDVNDDLSKRLNTVGRPLPGMLQRIVSEDGSDLPPGEVGEIRLKGHITPGYYKDPEQTALSFDEQGYFRTGDLGFVDEEGFLYFRGRLKEMVKTGGINVSPAEVEAVLMSHPDIYMALVVGVPDHHRDEVLGAVIIPVADRRIDEDGVKKFARENLAAYKVPRLYSFASERELPLTTTGKVQKNKLADTFFCTVAG
ncbi:class I adenylate-forming enzyme family protein [Sinorhizobium medicae]|uniref:Putative AMP-dependent synthetase and ligase n=1 Tax=Sinorhizobium medicae TaxID=110321 RepID=A0A508X7B3_9HYPH|nr:AMP-binding protein [Sinorhizobium medicae]VTZ65460.1 putative AMP-dependent synthetase and ligase [Sinorhizobium medicae]